MFTAYSMVLNLYIFLNLSHGIMVQLEKTLFTLNMNIHSSFFKILTLMGLLFIMSRLLSGQYFKVSPKPSGDFLSKMKNGSPGIYREAKTTPTGQKPMRQHRLLIIGIFVALIVFILAVWMFGWD